MVMKKEKKSKTSLDTTLSDYFGKHNTRCANKIGLEIEVEGPGSEGGINTGSWKAKFEDSLRDGGVEYIVKKPFSIKEVDEVLKDWANSTRDFSFKKSIRTSVHVHVDVTDLTLKQIYNIIGVYWLVENLLVHRCGKDREGNLFCLRVCDAEYTVHEILANLKKASHFGELSSDNFRYSAMNFASLWKFGTLEFRFINGTTNTREISEWIHGLWSLVNNAKNLELNRVLFDVASMKTINGFLSRVFPGHFIAFLRETMTEREMQKFVIENYCYTLRLNRYIEDYEDFLENKILEEDLVEDLDYSAKQDQEDIPEYSYVGVPIHTLEDELEEVELEPDYLWLNPEE